METAGGGRMTSEDKIWMTIFFIVTIAFLTVVLCEQQTIIDKLDRKQTVFVFLKDGIYTADEVIEMPQINHDARSVFKFYAGKKETK
jgi:hypothetical protein